MQPSASSKDGRWCEADGLVLIRQRPGFAEGVMFITREDETGFANLVVWPTISETFRRTLMTASMMAVKGSVQREGEIVHLVAHDIADLSAEPAIVGGRDAVFEMPHGRGDQVARAAAPTRATCRRRACGHGTSISPTIHLDTIKVKSRNFQ